MTKRDNRVVPSPSTARLHAPYWGNDRDIEDGLIAHLMKTERQFPGDAGVFMYHAAPGLIQLQQSVRAATH
jgi:hypothetical protein